MHFLAQFLAPFEARLCILCYESAARKEKLLESFEEDKEDKMLVRRL